MNMTTEPIRLPAWVAAVLIQLSALGVGLLQGDDWRSTLAIFVGGLPVSLGLVALAESKRARTDSPATIDTRIQALASGADIDLPEDERDGCTVVHDHDQDA